MRSPMRLLTQTSLALLLAVACRDRQPPNSVRRESPTARPLSIGACLDTMGEEHALACAPPTVRRIGHTLTIRLASGGVLTFVNDSTGEVQSGTMFRGSVASVPLYITSSYGGERPPSYSLINGRTGAEIELDDLPLFAPDSARFAVSTPDWNDCELGNGGELGVWRMTDTMPALEWTIRSWHCGDASGWGASDLQWRTPDTLAFTQNDISDSGKVLGERRPKLLVRADAKWRIVDPSRSP